MCDIVDAQGEKKRTTPVGAERSDVCVRRKVPVGNETLADDDANELGRIAALALCLAYECAPERPSDAEAGDNRARLPGRGFLARPGSCSRHGPLTMPDFCPANQVVIRWSSQPMK